MRIIYGKNPVLEALKKLEASEFECILTADKASARIVEQAARAKGIEIMSISGPELRRIAGTDKHQGIAARLRASFRYAAIDDVIGIWKKADGPALILILDSIEDPHNLGALVRAASAAGAHGVIIPSDRAAQVTPLVAKASAGATEHVAIARETNLVRAMARLKEEGVWVAGLEAGSEGEIYGVDLKCDLAIVVGGEGKGIRRLVKESCDFLASIPMASGAGGVNSLNAAQAGAIALFEARRQRDFCKNH